jgi:hypothetical protein
MGSGFGFCMAMAMALGASLPRDISDLQICNWRQGQHSSRDSAGPPMRSHTDPEGASASINQHCWACWAWACSPCWLHLNAIREHAKPRPIVLYDLILTLAEATDSESAGDISYHRHSPARPGTSSKHAIATPFARRTCDISLT